MQVVQFTDAHEQQRRKDDADILRDIADRIENGEITECIVVANNREDNVFERFGTFQDRWRMLGAIEYAKSGVLND